MNTNLAALCLVSKSRGMLCNEISYLMPLGYNSSLAEAPLPEEPWITVDCLEEELQEKCGTPDWCPLNGKVNKGHYQEAIDKTSIEITKEIRE